MSRVAAWAAIALAAITFMVVAWRLNEVLLVIALSLAFAATLGEPIAQLERRGWSSRLAVPAVYLAAFGALLVLVAALVWPAFGELDPLLRDALAGYHNLQERLTTMTGPRMAWLANLPSADQVSLWLTGELPAERLRGLLGLSLGVGHALGVLAVAVILSIYWAPDRHRVERLWLSLLPPHHRSKARRLWRQLDDEVGAYIRSELVQTVLAVLLLALGYRLLGIDYPFTLALAAGLAWLVPLLGVGLALLPMLLFGLLVDPAVAVIGAVYTLAVLAVLEFYVQPRIHPQRPYWGVVLLLVMLALFDTVGLFGLILAPPIALAIQLALNEVLDTSSAAPVAAADLAALQTRLAAVRQQVDTQAGEPSPWLDSLVERLEALLAQVAVSVPIRADEHPGEEAIAPSSPAAASTYAEELPQP
jgi:predicted PurR-regulated permease PerM